MNKDEIIEKAFKEMGNNGELPISQETMNELTIELDRLISKNKKNDFELMTDMTCIMNKSHENCLKALSLQKLNYAQNLTTMINDSIKTERKLEKQIQSLKDEIERLRKIIYADRELIRNLEKMEAVKE